MTFEQHNTPHRIAVRCTECGATHIAPNKGMGRIDAAIFKQNHTCTEEAE